MDGARSRRCVPRHRCARKANHKGARFRGHELHNTVYVGTLARKGSLECHSAHSLSCRLALGSAVLHATTTQHKDERRNPSLCNQQKNVEKLCMLVKQDKGMTTMYKA